MHPLTVYVHIRLHYLQVICAVGGCRAVLKYCGNTTNLASHLKSQHLQEFLQAGFGSVVKKPEAVQHKQYHAIIIIVHETLFYTCIYLSVARLPINRLIVILHRQ